MAFKEALWESVIFGSGLFDQVLWTLKIEFVGSIYILLFYIVKPKEKIVIPLVIIFCLIYAVYQKDSIYFYAIFIGSLFNYFKNLSRYRFFIFLFGLYFSGFQYSSIA